jgi:DNA-binding transcriptional LysR family regulator
MDALSLDQFAVFVTVVEEGSFAAAARRMNRAQSAITYAIQKLEDQSGVEVFDRSAYRPVLTEAGKALLPRARRVLAELEEYRLHAKRMTTGLEDELSLIVHPYAPHAGITSILTEFAREFPSVRLNISVGGKDAAADALRDRKADVALMLELVPTGADIERKACRPVEFVLAAAPHHPLAKFDDEKFPAELLRDHRQLVMYRALSEEEAAAIRGYGMDGINIWRVIDFEFQRALVLAGEGWAVVPRSKYEQDFTARRMVLLRPKGWGDADHVLRVPLVVARATNHPPGPAARWLFERFGRKVTQADSINPRTARPKSVHRASGRRRTASSS